MSRTSMLGSWRGVYEYDPEFKINLRTGFVLDLHPTKWTWLTGGFYGSVQDLEGGVPGVGTIHGSTSWGAIQFLKTMPVAYGFENGKPVSIATALREKGHSVESEIKGFPIIYTGKRTDEDKAAGKWTISSFRFLVDGRMAQYPGKISGRWTMQRTA